MFLLIGNSGSNHNYIGFKLCGIKIKNTQTHHKFGTHGKKNNLLDISNLQNIEIEKKLKKNNYKGLVCFNSKFNEDLLNLCKKYNIIIIQILINKNQECLLINWHEKLRINPEEDHDKSFSKNWEEQQKKIWQNYTTFTVERAVCRWTYSLYDEEFIDIKKNVNAKTFFLFGSLYESYESTKIEFEKFSTDYSEEEYDNWKNSQKIIFDSWNAIKNNLETPKILEFDYQKGIAVALRGIKERLSEQECWLKYESSLN